jgi:glycosyltransferase involved in cell wall biosynthesis
MGTPVTRQRVAASENWNLRWHPAAKHIREDELGLTAARLHAIAEAAGKLCIFVDDDNVLNSTYLEKALAIGEEHPFLGAWGGTNRGEFEVEPACGRAHSLLASIAKPAGPISRMICGHSLGWRAVRTGARCKEVCRGRGNGAGLAKAGLIGSLLCAFEDIDLVETSCEFGLGFGGFPDLELFHLNL